MDLRDPDWNFLRQGLLWPGILLVVAGLAWGASSVYASRATTALEAERDALASLEAERTDVTVRRQARRQFARLFQEISNDGVVGSEHRLEWIQSTRDAARDLGLPYLRYTTRPQRPFEAAWLVPGVAAPVLVSAIDLQLGLVHEGDLLDLVGRLRAAPGLLRVEGCNLEMPGTVAGAEPDKANITGNCELGLYSIPREAAMAAVDTES